MEIASGYLSRKSSTAEARAKIPVRIPQSDPDTPKADRPANMKNKIIAQV